MSRADHAPPSRARVFDSRDDAEFPELGSHAGDLVSLTSSSDTHAHPHGSRISLGETTHPDDLISQDTQSRRDDSRSRLASEPDGGTDGKRDGVAPSTSSSVAVGLEPKILPPHACWSVVLHAHCLFRTLGTLCLHTATVACTARPVSSAARFATSGSAMGVAARRARTLSHTWCAASIRRLHCTRTAP